MKRFTLLFSLLACYYFQVYGAETNCVDCHQQQVSNWQQSDHAKAMAIANKDNVLGDFNNTSVNHFTQTAKFYQQDGLFHIAFTEANTTTKYTVAFTFGHYPLQQYLIETDKGQFQIFPFAWDSRTKALGGQRWFPIYANEDIKQNDRLHWQQKLQNWNGMCADCHSDGVKRNYSADKAKFVTNWDNINVGCQSCHGKMKGHQTPIKLSNGSLIDNKKQKQALLNWLTLPNEKVARLRTDKGELATKTQKRQRQAFMDTCFACHSLRSPLTDGFTPDKKFLDQFTPSFLNAPLYHANGQIKEEVYVYGSFLQSKMFQQGVTCLDCHDPHTMKVKSQTNGLCLQCHASSEYQTKTHTHHPLASEASQCINCHMPEVTYMGVDKRRDHSFTIPSPHLSQQYNTPNTCNTCHQDKSTNWAIQQLESWFGKPNTPRVELDYLTLHSGQPIELEQHLAVINDEGLAPIKRATALSLLPNSTKVLSSLIIEKWVENEEPLLRLAVAQLGYMLTEEGLTGVYSQLLNDQYRAIRVAAANHILARSNNLNPVSAKAMQELTVAQDVNAWRGEGLLNKSMFHQRIGNYDEALSPLLHSIEVDPYFMPSYINLADIYRQTQQVAKEKALYQQALRYLPDEPQIHFSYAMYLVRAKQKPKAVEHFKLAFDLEPENLQYAYFYLLSLDAIGKTKQALMLLKQHYSKLKTNEFRHLGLNFSQKLNDAAHFQFFSKE